MRVRPATAAAEELGRALKIVVDEDRWPALQPPMTAACSSPIMARLFPEAF